MSGESVRVRGQRVVRRQQRRQDCDQSQQDEHDERDQRRDVVPQALPGAAPHAVHGKVVTGHTRQRRRIDGHGHRAPPVGCGVRRMSGMASWTGPSSGTWQAARCPPGTALSSGRSVAQMLWARGHRGWKEQPVGGWAGLGGSPAIRDRGRILSVAGLRDGGDQGPGVGVRRRGEDLFAGADLDDPADVHDGDVVGHEPQRRQVVRDEQVRQAAESRRSLSRLRIWARIETSSAETASSQMITRGSTASARAIDTRCRWPPESWRG